ncbi:unnamed protein product, partial [Urochloa humidicola]
MCKKGNRDSGRKGINIQTCLKYNMLFQATRTVEPGQCRVEGARSEAQSYISETTVDNSILYSYVLPLHCTNSDSHCKDVTTVTSENCWKGKFCCHVTGTHTTKCIGYEYNDKKGYCLL